ncbi:hypothetical protein FA95DRAFT_1682718 [Auriscalpium vulgare]|uniref:Uncharacterized protein n=1 Tax=Auriscalpium vulgare TaxID=40419 RepID=A0ACB8RE48_9AGAM|nr:hypothetical protein FA95DRAFT_1682718 [Auriscalpium vulgare]
MVLVCLFTALKIWVRVDAGTSLARELERLEINENSVVHVTDEEIGGRRSVIKVGGVDVGSGKELNGEENGPMLLLQIVDSAESQKWINAIKSAVLGQRCVYFTQIDIRAGLGLPSLSMNGTEPRGDLNVMLSMRMQGILPSPTQSTFSSPSLDYATSPTSSHAPSHTDDSAPATQPSTVRSHRPSSPRAPSAVLSLKDLFTGSTRPRSPSRAASPDPHDQDASGESFGSVGSSLLMSMRSGASAANGKAASLSLDGSLTPSPSPLIKPFSMLPPTGPALELTPPSSTQPLPLQRKIVQNRTTLDWAPPSPWAGRQHARARGPPRARAVSSLQPPPHRRRAWTTIVSPPSPPAPHAPSSHSGPLVYTHGNASFGVVGLTPGERSPSLERGTPTQKARAASVSSVSTLGSGSADRENHGGLERAGSAAGSGRRRWSRQLIMPHRLTPPAGAPPPVPQSWQSNGSASPPLSLPLSHRLSHPYSAERSERDRPPSRASSLSQKTLPSIVSSLQMGGSSGGKRASGSSSVYSVATNNSSPPQTNPLAHTRAINSNRLSVPPPQRPAPSAALPPTPSSIEAPALPPQPVSAPPMKTSFRDSLAHRAFRLSLIPPTSPPAQGLPPRPDEPAFRGHGHGHARSASIDGRARAADSTTALPDPLPPPTGPLPPPPASPVASSPRLATTFKQRLRILSAPSPAPSPPPLLAPALSSGLRSPVLDLHISTATAARTYTPPPPGTPIAERITLTPNDPDSFFPSMSPTTPTLGAPSLPIPVPPPRSPFRPLPQPQGSPNGAPAPTPLSPPPRRGSRQIATPDREAPPRLSVDADVVLPPPEDAASDILGEYARVPEKRPSMEVGFERNASSLSLDIGSDARVQV